MDGAIIAPAGHLVAFQTSLKARVRGPGLSPSPWLTRGAARTVELTGRGTVLVSTRDPRTLVDWVAPLLPE